jgi:hypothetical protein
MAYPGYSCCLFTTTTIPICSCGYQVTLSESSARFRVNISRINLIHSTTYTYIDINFIYHLHRFHLLHYSYLLAPSDSERLGASPNQVFRARSSQALAYVRHCPQTVSVDMYPLFLQLLFPRNIAWFIQIITTFIVNVLLVM